MSVCLRIIAMAVLMGALIAIPGVLSAASVFALGDANRLAVAKMERVAVLSALRGASLEAERLGLTLRLTADPAQQHALAQRLAQAISSAQTALRSHEAQAGTGTDRALDADTVMKLERLLDAGRPLATTALSGPNITEITSATRNGPMLLANAKDQVFDDLDSAIAAAQREAASVLSKAGILAQGRWWMTLVGIMVAAAAGTLLIAKFTKTTIAKPIAQVRDAVIGLMESDLLSRVDETSRKDEVGDLQRAARALQSKLLKSRAREFAAQRVRQDAVSGNARPTIDPAQSLKRDQPAELPANPDLAAQQSADVAALDDVGTSSSDEVLLMAKEASNNVATLAFTINELVESAHETALLSSKASSFSADALIHVHEFDPISDNLAQSTQSFLQTADTVSDIARRANRLAINAMVEAARAGPAARGFSAVATEVKFIASEAAGAADEVSAEVANLRGYVDTMSASLNSLKERMANASEAALNAASAFESHDAKIDTVAEKAQSATARARDCTSRILSFSNAATDSECGTRELVDAIDVLSGQAEALRTRLAAFRGAAASCAA